MSSSSKKKLRQEQVATAQTQKQKAAKKESDRVKIYTGIFFAVIVFMIVVVIIASVERTGIINRNVTALKVGDQSVSSVEANIYFTQSVNEFLNQFGQLAEAVGLDLSAPLDKQVIDEDGTTWADRFLESGISNLHRNYALYLEAKAAGYTLPEESVNQLNSMMESLEKSAAESPYKTTDKYLSAIFGSGTTLDLYRQIAENEMIAQGYEIAHHDALTYSADEIKAKDSENPVLNNSYTYVTYVMTASEYLQGGTEDENGKKTYSDEEVAASIAACKADAEALVATGSKTAEELDAAIAKLAVNKDQKDASLPIMGMRYTDIPEFMREWISDSSRKAGDITYVERTSTDEDGNKTIVGYNVVVFKESSDNRYPLVNARHILIPFEGGTKDPSTGSVTYSEQAKKDAKDAAQAILDQWKAGVADEDSFAALATEKSQDPGSAKNGGLYEDIFPRQMSPAFNDWCFDESRKAGDVGLVETEYGYHVMFYSGTSETLYRDFLISTDLRNAEIAEWNETILEKYPLVKKNLSRVATDLIINPNA